MAGKTCRDSNPWYEMAVSAWNLAAIKSKKAQMDLFENSDDDEVIKGACANFQLAGTLIGNDKSYGN